MATDSGDTGAAQPGTKNAGRTESIRRQRRIHGVAVGAGMLAALIGTSAGSSGGGSATSGVAYAPQSFPSSSPCPISGDGGGDPALDVKKNRFIAPTAIDMSSAIAAPADMIKLAQPSELKSMRLHRSKWPNDSAVQQVLAFEGQAVTIVGYLIGAKPENAKNEPKGESCNCHDPTVLFDYHLYMADQPHVPISKAVVVEMTPRWRAVNPTWGTADDSYAGLSTIQALTNQRVRVTGWLLFDEEHLNQVGEYRATVWEVHPITKFEYEKNGSWVTL